LQGLRDGTIDAIASDHAPHHADEKLVEFDEAPFGIIGLETTVPLVLDRCVRKEGLAPARFVELLAQNPARILGINKGTLAVGADADVTIIDPDLERTVDVSQFKSKARNSPFHGTSPRIDALARQATVFDSAWSAAPWTLPSVMSIMTSRLPSSHRVENDGLKLGADVPTLAETMRRAGYSTGAFVSHVYVSSIFGFDRGFETFEDFGVSRPSYRPEARMEPAADRVTDSALAW